MKKIVALILMALVLAIPLTGCSNNNEVIELQNQVESLQAEISELKGQTSETTSAIETTEATTENETSESSNAPIIVTDAMLDFLTKQLNSDYYADWDAVASCSYATEEHLLIAAKKCANISNNKDLATSLATNICKNPAATGKVIKELSGAYYYKVIEIAAQSKYADEDALIAIAKECADISNNKDFATSIATNICENPAATGKVIKELSGAYYYKVIEIAAQSKYADEDALIAIAKECADISNNKDFATSIATNICENPAATGKVIKELSDAYYYKVIDIAAQSKYADEDALIAIAKECANISNNKEWATSIATSICKNPATTNNVLIELANSNYTSVTALAHAKLEKMYL